MKNGEWDKNFIPKVLASPGIGNNEFEKSFDAARARFKGKETEDNYITKNGEIKALPHYLRNKIYNDNQKEYLWMNKLDNGVRYINGIEIRPEEPETKYLDILREAQRRNERNGFGKREKPREARNARAFPVKGKRNGQRTT